MAKRPLTVIGVAAAALALSGCQGIPGSDTASRDADPQLDIGDYFEGRLAVGRYYLEKGLVSKAVVAFRQASYDARYAGEAYNGMAIAYDRLGRDDLAQRYFAMAVEAAPNDARFSRNLARLEGRTPVLPDAPHATQVEMARLEMPELPVDQVAERLERRGPITIGALRTADAAAITVVKPQAETVRLSRSEVHVAPATAVAVAEAASPVRAAVRVEPRASRMVIKRARRSAQARKGYPVRVVFNSYRASPMSQD